MKKNKVINLCIILICGFIIFFSAISTIDAFTGIQTLNGCSVLSEAQNAFLQKIFTWIRIIVPILLVVLIIKDFAVAAMSGEEKEMKSAQQTAIKRLIVGVVIMLVPTIVNIILDLIGKGYTTCGIK